MKLKKILEENYVNLREYYFEDCLHIKDITPNEVFDLIISSDELSCVEKISSCKNEDLKDCVTLLLSNNVELHKNIKLNLISFDSEGDKVLLRLTRDSFSLKQDLLDKN